MSLNVEPVKKKKLYNDEEEDELEIELHKYDDDNDDDDGKVQEDAQNYLSCMESLKPKLRKLLGLKSQIVEKPEDYWRNPVNFPWLRHIFPLKVYLMLSNTCDTLVMKDETFNLFIICTIIVAGLLVGIQTYDGMDKNVIIIGIDYVILGIFCMECTVKIVKEGLAPTLYFRGIDWKWNCFDFTIVFLSFPQITLLLGGSGISLLRLVRLARLGKLIRKIPQLNMIVSGLIGGLSSIVYVMGLLLLIFYLYGVVGYYLFRTNDPFHMGSVPSAMITLLRMATLCNWGDIMYLNILGCDVYSDMYESPNAWTPHNRMLWCKNPGISYYLAPIYFISFIVLAGFVMLSLFIGAVTSSMSSSMQEALRAEDIKKKEAARSANLKKIELVKKMNKEEELMKMIESLNRADPDSPHSIKLKNQLDDMKANFKGDSSEFDDTNNIGKQLRSYPFIGDSLRAYDMYKKKEVKSIRHEANTYKSKLCYLLKIGIGEIIIEPGSMERKQEEREMNELGPQTWLYLKFSRLCKSVVYSTRYQNLVTLAILVASVNVGATTDIRVENDQVLLNNFNQSDTGVLVIFGLEIILKIIGEGFSPWTFFNDNWNKFDFFVVVGSILPSTGGLLPILRLLRLLRVLKLIKFLPQLGVIINALLMGLSSIFYVGIILLLFTYVYAIIGMIFFQESDPWRFRTLHEAMIALFRAATLDGWNDWMYTVEFGCGRFQSLYSSVGNFQAQCNKQVVEGPGAVVYFITYIIIGGCVLLNLFIGVVATSMDHARSVQKDESELETDLKKITKELSLPPERLDALYQAFRMLDLDDGGKIEETEIKIGLEAIESTLVEEDILTILDEVDSEREGINVVGFIRFMSVTPSFQRLKTVGKQIQLFGKKDDKKTSWFEKTLNYVYKQLLGAAARQAQAETEAALTIQNLWRSRKAKREAAHEIERRKEWRRKQKLKENAH